MTTLAELARSTYEEYESARPEFEADNFARACEEFLTTARSAAERTLCEDASALDWTYTPGDQLPDEVEQATALLEPGRPEYLRYRWDHGKEEGYGIELVRPCSACGHDRIDPVNGLLQLGRILAEGSAS
ncbi:hypothetical protein [Streptomyces sp. NPDC046978]|uniref:hypothetical protein n=1 Tax=Streptomyces sp. NPDC046978 TaxID=3154704 RepID=UPI0033DA85F9